jgi:hypothetical protein
MAMEDLNAKYKRTDDELVSFYHESLDAYYICI